MEPITFIITTEELDRHSERVIIDGLDAKSFMQNPVGYYNHHRSMDAWSGDADSTKITPIVRWENLRAVTMEVNGMFQKVMLADAVFDPEDEMSVKIYNKVKGGFINCASIGFRALAWSDAPEDRLDGQWGYTFTKWELYEISIVDIPSNRSATVIKNLGGAVKTEAIEESKAGEKRASVSTDSYLYKSFSAPKLPTNKTKSFQKPKEEDIMKKSIGQRIIASIFTVLKGSGATMKKADGTDLTPEDIKPEDIEAVELAVTEEAIKEVVDPQIAEVEKKLKALGESLAEAIVKATPGLSKDDINALIAEKGFVPKSDLDKVVKELADLKSGASGGTAGNNGGAGIGGGTGGDSPEDALENNPQFKQLKSMLQSGAITQDVFNVQKSNLLKVTKK
jgi:hypothetical protein